MRDKAWLIPILVLLTAASLFATDSAEAVTRTANGSVQHSRLPWIDGQGIILTQGWGGATSHNQSYTYHATDWGPAGGGTFAVYAVTESQGTYGASCAMEGSWGYRVLVNRTNSPDYDRYAHLPQCPFGGADFHLEQGDFISNAGDTGGDWEIHLHYQRENSSGNTVSHCLSNFCDFADSTYNSDTFVSDNAGPGVGGSSTAQTKIRNAYVNNGHYLCSGEAWDCFGSSINFLGEGRKAGRTCPASDCGWNQDFYKDKIQNFDWPEACTSISAAYWVPDQFFVSWLSNTWLGQARSSVINFLGTYYQFFRYGYMTSPTFGGTPTIYSSPTTSCES